MEAKKIKFPAVMEKPYKELGEICKQNSIRLGSLESHVSQLRREGGHPGLFLHIKSAQV